MGPSKLVSKKLENELQYQMEMAEKNKKKESDQSKKLEARKSRKFPIFFREMEMEEKMTFKKSSSKLERFEISRTQFW